MTPYPRPALPRLLFKGRFFTDPSTVNNEVKHYDTASFRPNYQLRQDSINNNGLWNPEGTGAFALVGCTVTAAKTSKGAFDVSNDGTSADSLLSRPIIGNDHSVQAKIADLDPQLQLASQIWGLRFGVGDEQTGFFGTMETAPFRDLWSMLEGARGIPSFSAVYQSVINLSSFSAGDSQFLKDCESFVTDSKAYVDLDGNKPFPNGALSVRFRVSGYSGNYEDNSFRYGTAVGVIQPWIAGEPWRFDAGRIMRPLRDRAAMNAYAYVQKEANSSYSLYVDLVNSFVEKSDGTLKDIGSLYVVTLPIGGDSSSSRIIPPDVRLGKINYLDASWLDRTGGVVELKLSSEQMSKVEESPLGIVALKDERLTILLAEPSDGFFIRADDFVYRLSPADCAKSFIYVTKFGKRASSVNVSAGLDSTSMQADGSPTAGVPASGLLIDGQKPDDANPNDFKVTVKTNKKGVASLSIIGGDPKNSRGYIDGQVYGIRYGVGQRLPPLRRSVNNNEILNVLVFDKFSVPETPSWIVDILPIFKQYANLYPSMDRIVSLDDYGSCVFRASALSRAFGSHLDDPHYMPVTRDLSAAKRTMILKWLRNVDQDKKPLYMNIRRREDLLAALQIAIELEHATLPPYLCALYSIKQGYNQFVSDALRDVAMEEMYHFALVCNILISIGGRPNINKVGFVPKYPGSLPGGLRRGLILRLRKCSIEQLEAFMSIEAPELQAVSDCGTVDGLDDIQMNNYTIAFLYDEIKKSLRLLHSGGEISFPEDKNSDNYKFQVEGWQGPGDLRRITSLGEAIEAINVIKEQGEGASPTMPSDGETDPITGLPELSHYFRFAEIVKGRRIVVKDGGFSYSGEKIVLNEEGIYKMQDNPNVRFLPIGSQARDRLESFSRKYQAMLNGLHITFNGQPEYLREAVALMSQLTMSAKPLMEMPALNLDGSVKSDGTTVGVSFQVPFS